MIDAAAETLDAKETRLRVEWRQAKRRGSTVAVLAIDLDHFKGINDTRGHPFGDVVLQDDETSRLHASITTSGDVVTIETPGGGGYGAP